MPSQQAKRRATATDGPIKRFRVSRACDQCRTERSKCDGVEPQCGPCFGNKRTCTFTSNPRKRGLPPGYIRTIELALAIVLQENAEIETALLTKLAQPDTVLLARDTKESNKLHKTWRKTKFCRSLNKALTGENAEIEEENEPSSDDENGVPSHGAALADEVSNATIISPILQYPPASVPSVPGPGPEIVTAKDPSELTPLPSNCWRFIETYAAYTQCWLPISEKLDILKLSYSYPSQGLPLSNSMPDAGHHAEMWSMFALGALQESTRRPEHVCILTAKKLYAITRSLLPDELGLFQLGHVKAILNLAVYNISRQLFEPAWLLVGAASRVLFCVDETTLNIGNRRPHVFAACFVLDNLLALILDRPAYLRREDLEKAGKIEEDGLEEWQPWVGDLTSKGLHQSQSPTLTFSTFNSLVAVTDILTFTTKQTRPSNQDPMSRYETWKASLPATLDYVRTESITVPFTPPALLLQLASFTTSFCLRPVPMSLHRIFDLMGAFREHLGLENLPSVSVCLLRCLQKSAANMPQELRNATDQLLADFSQKQTRSPTSRQNTSNSFAKMSPVALHSPQAMQSVSPQSFQHPPPPRHPPPVRHASQTTTSSLLNNILPDMNPNNRGQSLQSFDANKADADFTSPGFDPYDPAVSGGDLDSFFDELTYLHGAKKLQNQGQFMENLGFAPEYSMADLLATQSGQFIPMHPAFGADQDGTSMQFPLNDFYDVEGGG